MAKPDYHCSQQELYAVGRLGWNACSARISDFSAFKTKYTEAFVSERMAEISSAEELPDEMQREEDFRTLRVSLKDQATECLSFCQQLKRYIAEAYTGELTGIKLNAAGHTYYRRAAQYDWISMQRLLVDGSAFITENKQELIAKGHMPGPFEEKFLAARHRFDQLFSEYLGATQESELETQEKLKANNEVYRQLMSMFLDGQSIFKDDEVLRRQFTFEQVLFTSGGPGAQGIRGEFTRTDGKPVSSGEVIISGPAGKTAAIDEKGRYECVQLPAAKGYTLTIKVAGCEEMVIHEVEITTGTMKTVNATLVSLQANPA